MADMRTRDAIATDYQEARATGDAAAMARFQNEEACLILLTVLSRLAQDQTSFIHGVALKGGMLMAGELRSPRVSADIDLTSGHQKRIDVDGVAADLRRAGREFNLRQDREPDRTSAGSVVHLRFDSLTDRGTAKLEISVREDLVFAVRDAVFNLTDVGLEPFCVPALAQVELVAEKLRALTQRSQPRDLFDLWLYLTQSGWHLDGAELRKCLDAKLSLTRHKKWRAGLWRTHLAEIETQWEATLLEWVPPKRLVSFAVAEAAVSRRLHGLRLD
jgi:predicted nucleotidyltransferase component of viral defense system